MASVLPAEVGGSGSCKTPEPSPTTAPVSTAPPKPTPHPPQHPKEAVAFEECFTIENHWNIESLKCHILKSKCERSGTPVIPKGLEAGQTATTAPPTDQNCGSLGISPACVFCRYQKDLKDLPQWPEMIFAENFLELTHIPSGAILRFEALDALKGVDPKKDWVKVEASEEWKAARKDVAFINNTINPFDWTFFTDYPGTMEGEVKILPTVERIDLEKLKVQERILFYEEMTLFEDELADHGCASLSIKFRAMPSGWFALLRYYLRVDHVLVRVTDTRLRWEVAAPSVILREHSTRQARLSELKDCPKIHELFFDPQAVGTLLPSLTLVRETLEVLKLNMGESNLN